MPRRALPVLLVALILCQVAAVDAETATAAAPRLDVRAESYTLPNGLTVILHEDHRLPQVVINTWFNVASKDEAPGRSGFAHLFEHLMFMGTTRVPGNAFDVIMETGGGANNASTSTDRTNYFSWGPSALLPTLLWLDADRLEGLGKAVTAEKLDLQRSVVRNERRQNYENRPYGQAELAIPAALYPEGHPYHHPVIGSHEDLEAARVEDVKQFFATYYVPGNATLVVAGDFQPDEAKKLIAQTFGAVPAQPVPAPRSVRPARLEREARRILVDDVSDARIYLVWHSPAAYAPGDAEMELIAAILSDGGSGRLFRRLVLDEQLAQDVSVVQDNQELGSALRIVATAAPGADLERIRRVVVEELRGVMDQGPTAAELARVKAAAEASFLRRAESLLARADRLNEYRRFYGEAASFERDLARRLAPTEVDLTRTARAVFSEPCVDVRVLPEAEGSPGDLDARPADLPARPAGFPVPDELRLANGIPVQLVARPGSGLFSAVVLVDGGERAVPADKAGVATLIATLLTKGAGERDAAAFGEAVASLGARIDARATWRDMRVDVSGLASRLAPTLDLVADALLRPTLSDADIARERELQLAAVRARADNPRAVAATVFRALLYGRDDARGRPASGWAATVSSVTAADVRATLPRLLDPARARLIVVGDVDRERLLKELNARLGGWRGAGAPVPAPPPPLVEPAPRLVLVDRPGAPQTVLLMARPLAAPDDRGRAVRAALNTVFGGSFTSRLNQNIREKHGFSYGARSFVWQDGDEHLLQATSSVHAQSTGAALGEFRNEFTALGATGISAEELEKARRTTIFELASAAETSGSLADALAELAANRQPATAPGRQLEELGRLDLDAVNRVARDGTFDFSRLLVVLVGDREKVTSQLADAGFPAPELVDAEARPVGR